MAEDNTTTQLTPPANLGDGSYIEQNTDGTATINFPGGGQHTVKGPASALVNAYGVTKVVSSGMSSAQQQQRRQDRFGEYNDAVERKNKAEQIAATEAVLSTEVVLTEAQLATAIQRNGSATRDVNHPSNKIAIKNAILGMSMGLSFDEATDMSSDGGFYTMLREGYADDTWTKNTSQLTAADLQTKGGRLKLLQSTLTSLAFGQVGSNTDTRDWAAAVTSGDAIKGLQVATNQMYGGVTVKYQSGGYEKDEQGRDLIDRPLPPSTYLVGGNGTVLTQLSGNTQQMYTQLLNYGIKDLSFAGDLKETLGGLIPAGSILSSLSAEERRNGNLVKSLDILEQNSYGVNYWEGKEYLFDLPLATVNAVPEPTKPVAPTITAPSTAQDATSSALTPPTSTAPPAGSGVPTYEDAPQAVGNVGDTTTPGTGMPEVTPPGVYPATSATTGTFGSPLQTAGLSAVPTYQTQQGISQPSGFSTEQLTQTMPGTNMDSIGVKTVQYENQYGQSIPVTETNGQPVTYVPPGYTKTAAAAKGGMMRKGYAEGGTAAPSEDTMLEAKYRIATMNGYNGPKTNAALNSFANASEGMKRKFNAIGTVMANKGGMMRKGFDEGGLTTEDLAKMQASAVQQTMQPIQAPIAQIAPQAADFIPTSAGAVTGAAPMAEAATVGTVEQSMMPMMTPSATVQPTTIAPAVQQETAQLQAAQGTVAPEAQVTAAQQATTSVSGMEAAQGTAYMMSNPVQREIQAGELISGVADAEKAAQFNEQIQAATATPTKQATVQGQLETLMQQFEGGETPAWAAGSMRAAMANLSARGLGASSMAGQAVIQAAMEAALPIAQIDAQTQAQFESQNLSNRQQRAMLAAQQRAQFLGMEFDQEFQARVANSARIGDIANMNFTAEQQVALENSRAANTMELNNLSNRQALVMSEAAALSNLDMANLNNRQQAAVQNAQNFLQMDMTNLNNEQQTAMFKTQQNLQALFTDQAATNAAQQFNASSENQTNQFFSNLTNQTSQFNAAQRNAMDQFNVNSVNALREFNSEIQQQRDLFNAQNGLVVAQANAQWRQNIATINTAQQNQSNMDFAKTMNALTANNMDQIWQRERDLMSFAFASAESAADRAANIALAKLTAEEQAELQDSIGKGKLVALGVEGLIKKWLG